jgi:HPt (histidine-containing phosphotransfer) domain-containing protein
MSDYKYIDMTYLNDLAMGSNDFMIEMLESFTKTTPESIQTMKNSVGSEDWKIIGGLAHKLKTSYSFMGMDNMVTLSKTLQDLGLEGEGVEKIPGMIEEMHQEYIKAETELLLELDKLKND